ncbi:hypothetical protein K458DRAFT_38411 [Lentithecium fluviatile CBS 122367]|uniref:Uncharacterized protein n=1 Tax=Lentithecium fluviatile CBS 122367 TaxID=1168545 RepID=A0A6G1J1L2_9PLEO|nr:hypothetical protein K458DRAFT_38411 [Lentithecium fluviatile CBS 122367]
MADAAVSHRSSYEGWTPRKMLCNFCLDLHRTAFFDLTKLAKSPHEHNCKGATSRFYVCSHKSHTFQELYEHRCRRREKDISDPGCCSRLPVKSYSRVRSTVVISLAGCQIRLRSGQEDK